MCVEGAGQSWLVGGACSTQQLSCGASSPALREGLIPPPSPRLRASGWQEEEGSQMEGAGSAFCYGNGLGGGAALLCLCT